MNLRGFAGQASDTKREHVQIAVIRWGRIPATRNYPRLRSFGGFCQPEDFLDVQRLGIHVSLAISREARGEDALQIGELASGLGVGPGDSREKQHSLAREDRLLQPNARGTTEAGPGESICRPGTPRSPRCS